MFSIIFFIFISLHLDSYLLIESTWISPLNSLVKTKEESSEMTLMLRRNFYLCLGSKCLIRTIDFESSSVTRSWLRLWFYYLINYWESRRPTLLITLETQCYFKNLWIRCNWRRMLTPKVILIAKSIIKRFF